MIGGFLIHWITLLAENGTYVKGNKRRPDSVYTWCLMTLTCFERYEGIIITQCCSISAFFYLVVQYMFMLFRN